MTRVCLALFLFLFLFLSRSAAAQTVTTIAGVPGVAGAADGRVDEATFNRPTWLDVVVDSDPFGAAGEPGDIYVVDRANSVVRRIDGDTVSTLRPRDFRNLPVPLDFDGPLGGGIAIEPKGAGCGAGIYGRGMFVASSGTQQIVHLSFSGQLASRDDVSPLIGAAGQPGAANGEPALARFHNPTGIGRSWRYPNFDRARDRALYIADTGNHTIRNIRFVLSFEACPQHKFIQTLAGEAGLPGSQDGVGAAARFHSPRGVVGAPDGSVYVADSGNHTIRRIAPDGTVTTVAGRAGEAGSSDGPALQARLNTPSGIDVHANGDLYIADTGNSTIRVLSNGVLTTLAGKAGEQGHLDGPPQEARFAGPVGIKLQQDGSLLIADTSNNAIRKYTPAMNNRRRVVR